MVKPAKRPAAVLNDPANSTNQASNARPTRGTRASTRSVPSQPSSAKPTATVPKKRKIDVPDPIPEPIEELDPSTIPSSQESQSSDAGSPQKRAKPSKREKVSKPKEGHKELLPLPVIPKDCGALLSVGTGDIGQLGLGEDIMELVVPRAVTSIPESICDVVAGGMHSACLTKSGVVYTFGCNDEGALGRLTPNEEEQFEPAAVDIAEKVVQISAGDSHMAALTESGKVFIWGNFRDNKGQLGLTSESDKGVPLPIQIMKNTTVIQICSGGNHILLMDEDGLVYSCGNCEHGQLGRLNPYNLERGGRGGVESILTPMPVKTGRNIHFDKIWAGTYTSYARARNSGEIYGFGLNNYRQLGVKKKDIIPKPILLKTFSDNKWKAFSGGEHHTLALDAEGVVHSLGRYEYGRLGLGVDAQDVPIPTAIPKLKDVECLEVSCCGVVSYAVTKEGTVYSWGSYTNNQLGHNAEEDLFEPKELTSKAMRTRKCFKVSVGGQHVLFMACDKDEQKENGQ